MTSARTALLVLLGHPVAHSRSPAMMTAVFAALGIDGVYVACDVLPPALPDAVRGLRALGALGANVTVPHKRAVLALCDEVTPRAHGIGAVNTLVQRNGRLVGDNTDAAGAMAALRDAGIDPRDRDAVVWGTGGAARAVAFGLAAAGAPSVTLVARNAPEGRAIAEAVRATAPSCSIEVVGWGSARAAVASATLLVQATPLGMVGAPEDPRALASLLAALEAAPARAAAMDLVYAPRETSWLRAARARGLATVDGLGMLAHQGASAVSQWFDVPPPAETLRRFLDAVDASG